MNPVDRWKITRRSFIKGMGAGAGILGLSQVSRGLIGCVPPQPDLLNGIEMVGNLTDDAAAIRLVAGDRIQAATQFQVLYDTVQQTDPLAYAQQTSVLSGFDIHDPIHFDLNALSPDTRYYYRVASDEGSGWSYGEERTFHTRRPPGSPFRFCIVTDTHINPNPYPIAAVSVPAFQNAVLDNPDLLITLGDVYVPSWQGIFPSFPFWSEQDAAYDHWSRVRGVLDNCAHSAGFLYVMGNHDGESGWDIALPQYGYSRNGRLAYLPTPDASTYPEGGDPYGRYGAFTWGDALFVWLDSQGFCTVDPLDVQDNSLYLLGTEQRDFLEATLANSTATWKFVMAHHLFGGNDTWERGYGRGNGNSAHLYDHLMVRDLMVQYGAQFYLYGHDHLWTVSENDGISYVCGGNSYNCVWEDIAKPKLAPYVEYYPDPDAPDYDDIGAGHVRVDVEADRVTFAYIKASKGADNGTLLRTYVRNL